MLDPIGMALAEGYTDELKKSGGVGYTSWEVIYPETKLGLYLDGSMSRFEYWIYHEDPNFFRLTAGQKYKVVWNGVEYLRDAVSAHAGLVCVVGNLALVDSESSDTGEPFAIAYYKDGDSAIRITSTDSDATMSITAEIVRPIEDKYLPDNVGTAVIDLDNYGIGGVIFNLFVMSGGGSQTIEDLTGFWAEASTSRSVKVRLAVGTDTISVNGITRVFNSSGSCTQIGFTVMLNYSGTVYTITVNIQKSDDNAIVAVKVA